MCNEGWATEGDGNRSGARAEWSAALDGVTKDLLAEDSRYFMRQVLSTPCLNGLRACAGAYIEDLQGRRLMDWHGNSVHQVGYGNAGVIDAIKHQLDSLSFCPRRYTNEASVALARELAERAPGGPHRVLFCPGGAEAVGIALQLARVATSRHKVLSMWDSFHGATLDAISVGGERLFRRGIGPLMSGVEHVPPPYCYRCLWGHGDPTSCGLPCAAQVEYVLEREGDVGALIAEPVRGVPILPPPGYWQRIRAACDRHGTLLIFDEIPHALGRTGALFVSEHYCPADVLVLGKGLGGGILPLAAVVGRADLDVAADRALGHYTHEKNPVLCAAGLATLAEIDRRGLVSRARELGYRARERLQGLRAEHAVVGDVRSLGLLMGIEVVSGDGSDTPAPGLAERVMYAALARGLSFKVSSGNVLTLTPPLTIDEHDLWRGLNIIDECLREAGSACVIC